MIDEYYEECDDIEFDKRLSKKQVAFLKAYIEHHLLKLAVEHTPKTSIWLHQQWMDKSPIYASTFRSLKGMRRSMLEDAAFERAVKGVKVEHYHRGEIRNIETKYSDSLLAKLLNADNPEQYDPLNYAKLQQLIDPHGDEEVRSQVLMLPSNDTIREDAGQPPMLPIVAEAMQEVLDRKQQEAVDSLYGDD